ncbi:FAD-dependent oxidoreductase, partial [Sphingobacterium mizutaii]|uniref:FAD-dependent oxidoreductase n=1 Tax=Sphingobacterium mizutaii TaxID=1010 RepID=UPI001624F008
DALKKFEYHGINIGDVKLDFEQMFLRKAEVVLKNTEGLEFLMKKNKITRITGTASFVDNSVIKITRGGGEQQIKANHFIIATGSKPASLPGINIDKERIITSTEALSLKELPKSMVIIGGGVIGVEMASIFNRLGTKVTILEYADHLISAMDHELGKTLQKILKKDGIDIRLQQS